MRRFMIVIILTLGLLPTIQAQNISDLEERTLIHQDEERRFLLYTPPQADNGEPLPLVFMLHGATETPEIAEETSRFVDKAREEGFYVVYPAGTGAQFTNYFLTWNAGFCCSFAQASNRDEVGFFREMIATLTDDLAIDRNRIYVTGQSNGGMLTYRLAAEMSDVFAAAAISAGAIGGYLIYEPETLVMPPQPESPMPILHIHGVQDPIVPFNAVTEGNFRLLGVQDAMDFWVDANQCNSTPQVATEDNGMVTRTTYNCNPTNTTVNLIAIADGGHDWAGSRRMSRSDDMVVGSDRVNATDEIWAFFEQYSLETIRN